MAIHVDTRELQVMTRLASLSPATLAVIAAATMHAMQAAIIAELYETPDPLSPKMLADRLGATIPVASYHVGVLARKGLLTQTSTRPRRGATEHFYRPAMEA